MRRLVNFLSIVVLLSNICIFGGCVGTFYRYGARQIASNTKEKLQVVNSNIQESSHLVTSACSAIQTSMNTVATTFSITESVLDKLENAVLPLEDIKNEFLIPTYIMQAPITISKPGLYVLGNVVYGTITIESSDVTLDLNGNTIISPSYGVFVGAGAHNIVIKNGFIDYSGIGLAGVQFDNSSETNPSHNLTLFNLAISGYETGIILANLDGVVVRCCSVTQGTGGYFYSKVNNLTSENCSSTKVSSFGYQLVNCTNNCLKNCVAYDTQSQSPTHNIYAFSSYNGCNNVFQECRVCKGFVTSTSTGPELYAVGFYLYNEIATLINRCVVINVSGDGMCQPFGIFGELCSQCTVQRNIVADITGTYPGTGISLDEQGNFITKNIVYACDLAYEGLVSSYAIASDQYNPTIPGNTQY